MVKFDKEKLRYKPNTEKGDKNLMGVSGENDGFRLTYSAEQQEEVKKIRQKYLPAEEDKMEQLRRLDASVTKKGMIISLAIGILSVLVLGVGMCCVMVWDGIFVPGILIGIAGISGIILAYPVYVRITRKQREKMAPKILRLTEELMK